MRGGRRKSPDLIRLEGGRSRKKVTMPRPEPMTPSGWTVPHGLPPYARKFIKRYRKPLERANVLTSWDYDAFLVMACLAGEIRDHVQALAQDGYTVEGRQGGIVKHPRVSMLRAATQQFRLYAESFGLTPSGRCRLDISPKSKDDSLMSQLID